MAKDEILKLQPKKVITCPHCGFQYLPGEILYPENVVGIPTDVVKDPLGRVLYNDWREDDEPLSEETYICDSCNKQFIVEIDVSYKTKVQEPELDFSGDGYVSLLD